MPVTLDAITALVLIDLQRGTTGGDLAHPLPGVVAQVARLLHAFRQAGRPVFIVSVNPTDSAQSRIRTQAPGVPAQLPPGFEELLPEIDVQPTDLRLHKPGWNAFYGTPLHDELQKRGITGLVLAGVSTSIGVEGTARAAAERGYNVTFATDALTDRVAAAHDNSLRYIFPRLGELGTTDEVLAALG